MRKTTLIVTLLFVIATFGTVKVASAQEEAGSSKAPKTEDSVDAYRVDFSFNELEDGKKLNTRHYSLDLTFGREATIKIGTRVPIVSGSSSSSSSSDSGASVQYQYLDIGTRIWAQVIGHGDREELHAEGEISSLDSSAGPVTGPRLGPVVRQIKIEGGTALVVGKPIIIGSADDPNSKREFQLEAVVTKLK
jgi:hypothetical protein